MGFVLLIFAAALFRILKYFKVDHIIVQSVLNQIVFHVLEGVLFLCAFYLMNHGKGYLLQWILIYFLFFLPLSVYQVRYGKDDEKYEQNT